MKAIIRRYRNKKVYSTGLNGRKRKGIRAAAFFAAMWLMAFNPVKLYAEEGDGASSYIYHRHTGTAAEKGGCYGGPVLHIHEGSEADGGKCFNAPVYHVHAGNANQGGLCYGKEVYHVHTGDSSKEGGCYGPVYHTHEGSCYREESCRISYNRGYTYETWYGSCYHHGNNALQGRAYAKETHHNCGAGTRDTTVAYCFGCEPDNDRDSSHSYSQLNCSQGGSVTGFRLSCGKTETMVDGYEPDCPKTESTIDSYSLSCNKTGETIDSYELNCGRALNEPLGKIIIRNQTSGKEKYALLRAEFEDLSGGVLKIKEETFLWYDSKGELLGSGLDMQVGSNGRYKAFLQVINVDVDRERLSAEINVTNIAMPADTGNGGGDSGDSGEHNGQEECPQATPSATPSPSPSAAPVPAEVLPDTKETVKLPGHKKAFKKPVLPNRVKESSAVFSPVPKLYKVTEHVKTEEKEAIPDIKPSPQTISSAAQFFKSPAVRVITVTLGSVCAFSSFFLILFLLLRSVRVYNEDAEGKPVYLGRCFVKVREEGYFIQITENMTEHSETNRFCIKPGLFLLGKSDQEKLMVIRGDKKAAAHLCREMLVAV